MLNATSEIEELVVKLQDQYSCTAHDQGEEVFCYKCPKNPAIHFAMDMSDLRKWATGILVRNAPYPHD